MRLYFLNLVLATLATAATVDISILSTTDLHGNIFPYDYYAAKAAPRGLASIATLVAEARKANPNSLLVDCGDTIQGATLETVHQMAVRAGKATKADPMMSVMNYLKYDAMAMGNHEMNFGLKNLTAARKQAKFPWLSANTKIEPGGKVDPFEAYIVKTVAGVKVGLIGLTTPSIPGWEKPENYKGYRWISGVQAARDAIAAMKAKEKPDVIVIIVHSGLDRNLTTGQIATGDAPGENMVYQLATEVPGVDVILFGHTHQQLAGARVNGVLLAQGKNWGGSLAVVDLKLEGEPGHWKLTEKQSHLVPVTATTVPDPNVLEIGKSYHDAAEAYLMAPVAQSAVEMTGALARDADSTLIDMIQEVQLHFAKADVSFASLFNMGVRIRKGPVTVRELAALYVYDNELYAVEGNGQIVKDALENAARYFMPCPESGCPAELQTNPNVRAYNYDMAQGVSYEIDLRRAEGDRIRNLTYKGKPLQMDQKLRIAVNNYRAGGSGGYTMFAKAPVVWRSGMEIREMMIDYYREKKVLPTAPDNNWKLITK